LRITQAALGAAALWLLPAALAQGGNTIFGAGYIAPVPISVARGQILNLFVQGVGSKLTGPVLAPSLPLPTSLAGISVVVGTLPAPILAVRPILTCVNRPTSGCGSYTAISVQIPFELPPTGDLPDSERITVEENGASGGQLEAFVQPDQVHVVTNCERNAIALVPCPFAPAITHADGSPVSERSPAKPGEQVVMYAFGLGDTLPAVPTGHATPSPAPVTRDPFEFQLNFDYRLNAPPTNQLILPPGCSPISPETCSQLRPLFSGLTPGYAGLYQVNFIVPTPPPGTPRCNVTNISSNLTVTLIGISSFDGGGICVDATGNNGS